MFQEGTNLVAIIVVSRYNYPVMLQCSRGPPSLPLWDIEVSLIMSIYKEYQLYFAAVPLHSVCPLLPLLCCIRFTTESHSNIHCT